MGSIASVTGPEALKARVVEKANELGFDAVGVARADEPLGVEYTRYRAFLEAGFHGSMAYLEDSAEARRRLDHDDILKGARSVVCLARSYQRPERDATGGIAPLIARYARGHDYHNGLRKKLRKLAAFVRTLGEDVRARPLCDEEPVLERAWAARAGLGFVGKNGLVIVPGLGSYVLLGEVVTTLALPPDEPIAERCGSCTMCLDACPTNAFPSPFVLDARKCVAYLTIEHRGSIDASLSARMGEHLFGCDDCQSVCPFTKGKRPEARTETFAPLSRWESTELEALLAPDLAARWGAFAEGSPLFRAGPEGLARNAAIALGHRGDARSVQALRVAASSHPSELVRRAAVEALARLDA